MADLNARLQELREKAQKAIAGCTAMAGKEKLDPDEIRNRDAVTLIEVGIYFTDKKDEDGEIVSDINGTVVREERAVAVFAEFPNNYVNMGMLFKRAIHSWIPSDLESEEEIMTAIDEVSAEIKEAGGLPMSVKLKKNHNTGNKFNQFTFL